MKKGREENSNCITAASLVLIINRDKHEFLETRQKNTNGCTSITNMRLNTKKEIKQMTSSSWLITSFLFLKAQF